MSALCRREGCERAGCVIVAEIPPDAPARTHADSRLEAQRQRIQMVLLRESGMTQPAIAEAMGVSLSTVNRAHMAFDKVARKSSGTGGHPLHREQSKAGEV